MRVSQFIQNTRENPAVFAVMISFILSLIIIIPVVSVYVFKQPSSDELDLEYAARFIGQGYDIFAGNPYHKIIDPGIRGNVSGILVPLSGKSHCSIGFDTDCRKAHNFESRPFLITTLCHFADHISENVRVHFTPKNTTDLFGALDPYLREAAAYLNSSLVLTGRLEIHSSFDVHIRTSQQTTLYSLNPNLVKLVCNLSNTYSRNEVIPILKTFGTHVITGVLLANLTVQRSYRISQNNVILSAEFWKTGLVPFVKELMPIHSVVLHELMNDSSSAFDICLTSLNKSEHPKKVIQRIAAHLQQGVEDYADEARYENQWNISTGSWYDQNELITFDEFRGSYHICNMTPPKDILRKFHLLREAIGVAQICHRGTTDRAHGMGFESNDLNGGLALFLTLLHHTDELRGPDRRPLLTNSIFRRTYPIPWSSYPYLSDLDPFLTRGFFTLHGEKEFRDASLYLFGNETALRNSCQAEEENTRWLVAAWLWKENNKRVRLHYEIARNSVGALLPRDASLKERQAARNMGNNFMALRSYFAAQDKRVSQDFVTPCRIIHIVQDGETHDSIGKHYDISGRPAVTYSTDQLFVGKRLTIFVPIIR